MDILRITAGDSDPLRGQVTDRDGPVDLTGAVVTLHGKGSGTSFELACIPYVDQEADMGYFYTESPADITIGKYRIGIEVVLSGNTNWYPSGRWRELVVKAALPQV